MIIEVYVLVGKDHNSIHHQSIYCLLVEILEVVHDSTENEISQHIWIKSPANYNLRLQDDLRILYSMSNYGTVIWNTQKQLY